MAKVNKQRNKIIRTSVIFWIVVFIIYAAIFGPLINNVGGWPDWVKILTLVLVILLPLAGQGLIIYTELVRNKSQNQNKKRYKK